MRIRRLSAILTLVLVPAISALSQGLEVVPASVTDGLQPGFHAIDTVTLANKTAGMLRVDSITIRFLDGGANPRPADFTACKTCPPDSIGYHIYGGWLYGSSESRYLRYLRDSLFLIQDRFGAPVTVSLAPGASVPFDLHYPVNCPVCGRLPSYPGATRYAFTFIASEGSRAVLNVETAHASALIIQPMPSPQRAVPGAARDAAGRAGSGVGSGILYRSPAPRD